MRVLQYGAENLYALFHADHAVKREEVRCLNVLEGGGWRISLGVYEGSIVLSDEEVMIWMIVSII